MNMPKSRDIRAKMPSPKVILNAFLLVTVKVLNSYTVFLLYLISIFRFLRFYAGFSHFPYPELCSAKEKRVHGGNVPAFVTIQQVVSREVFWHEYAKIPRHTSQNAITEGDFKCILARNCEGTEQLRKDTDARHRKTVRRSVRKICNRSSENRLQKSEKKDGKRYEENWFTDKRRRLPGSERDHARRSKRTFPQYR